MTLFGLTRKAPLLSALRTLGSTNGWDIDAMLKKSTAAGEAKQNEAKKLRAEYTAAVALAEKTREQGLTDAVKILTDATGKPVDVSTQRKYAKNLLWTARLLDRKHLLTFVDTAIDTVLTFLNADRSVFAKMVIAADKANAEADAIEAKAVETLNKANAASEQATVNSENAFVDAMNKAAPMLATAAELEAAAKVIFRDVAYLTA